MSELIIKIWDEILAYMRKELSELNFNTWILPLKPIDLSENTYTISAPNSFTKKMIESKYLTAIENHLKIISDNTLHIVLTENGGEQYNKIMIKRGVKPGGQQYFLTEDNSLSNRRRTGDNPNTENMLNPKYTFQTFVKGKSNEFALAAAMAVANNPATAYNPLFIYGGAGLGKTHLMQAVAHKILTDHPDSRVVYLSSEKFTNDLIASLGDKSTQKNREFRKKYREIDVLLIDDIQFIAGKTGTQEEFFHTFNDLYGANKQIIISSDRPPKEIKTLEERLISRFEWGLTADIQAPDFETRVAILQNKLKMENITLPMDVLEYIAMNIKSNIRELEGALLKVIAYSTLMQQPMINLQFAKDALKGVIDSQDKKPITLDWIQQVVADHYHIKVGDLGSKNRSKQIAYPRQIAMYLSRQLTDLSLLKIAAAFNRDHSTVMHGVDKIEHDLKTDNELQKNVNQLIKTLQSE